MAALALVAVQLTDAFTYALLPRGAEANPLWASQVLEPALAAKAALVLLVLTAGYLLATKAQRYHGATLRDGLYLVGIIAGAFGAGSNYHFLGGS